MPLLQSMTNVFEKLGFFGDVEDDREDDELEEEDEAYPVDEEEDEAPSLFSRVRGVFSGNRREQEEEAESAGRAAYQPTQRIRPIQPDNVIRDERLMQKAQQAAPAMPRERIVRVVQIESCREIIKCLLQGDCVLINLENADPKDCGRIVDLLSGAAFALQGRMIKVAHLAYLLAPQGVEIVEERQDAARGHMM